MKAVHIVVWMRNALHRLTYSNTWSPMLFQRWGTGVGVVKEPLEGRALLEEVPHERLCLIALSHFLFLLPAFPDFRDFVPLELQPKLTLFSSALLIRAFDHSNNTVTNTVHQRGICTSCLLRFYSPRRKSRVSLWVNLWWSRCQLNCLWTQPKPKLQMSRGASVRGFLTQTI